MSKRQWYLRITTRHVYPTGAKCINVIKHAHNVCLKKQSTVNAGSSRCSLLLTFQSNLGLFGKSFFFFSCSIRFTAVALWTMATQQTRRYWKYPSIIRRTCFDTPLFKIKLRKPERFAWLACGSSSSREGCFATSQTFICFPYECVRVIKLYDKCRSLQNAKPTKTYTSTP